MPTRGDAPELTRPTELEASRTQPSTIISAPALLTSPPILVNNVIPTLDEKAGVGSTIFRPDRMSGDAESEGEVGCEIYPTHLQRFRGKVNGFGSSRVSGAVCRRFDVDDYPLSFRFSIPRLGKKERMLGTTGEGAEG